VSSQAAAFATTGNSDNRSDNDKLKVATVVQQIIRLIDAAPEKDKIMIIKKMAFNLMKQNGCYSS
jgi:hypothetical protein